MAIVQTQAFWSYGGSPSNLASSGMSTLEREYRSRASACSLSIGRFIEFSTVNLTFLPPNWRGFNRLRRFFSFPSRTPTSLTSSRRNRMDRCALRQTRAGIRGHFNGQSVLTIGVGGSATNTCLPFSFRRLPNPLRRSRQGLSIFHLARPAVSFILQALNNFAHNLVQQE